MRPGQKFADAELMGIPYRVVISEKTLKENSAEITNRKTGESKMISIDELRKEIK
jgi:prolyl-tRNA synthetase